jgi:hypothetical protein
MTVVEQITTAICAGPFFYRANMLVNSDDVLAQDMGKVWTFDGEYGPGMRVHLHAANGHWIYTCVGESSCCGGYLARWCD